MKKSLVRHVLVVSWLILSHAQAEVTLPKVISSHMVLQRERPLPIWGWADPGEAVTVQFGGATAAGKADDHLA